MFSLLNEFSTHKINLFLHLASLLFSFLVGLSLPKYTYNLWEHSEPNNFSISPEQETRAWFCNRQYVWPQIFIECHEVGARNLSTNSYHDLSFTLSCLNP